MRQRRILLSNSEPNENFTEEDIEVISHLTVALESSSTLRNAIDAAFLAAEEDLKCNMMDERPYGSAEAPISLLHDLLPPSLRGKVNLCRTFILRAGARLPSLERHSNSIQRLVSMRGSGSINIALDEDGSAFRANPITSPSAMNDEKTMEEKLSAHWNVVPANTWHYPEAGHDSNWYTIAFHSASSEEINDEYKPF